MEHAGARDAYTHAYVYIYTLFIFYYPSLACLVSRASHSDPLPLSGDVFSCVTRDAWRIFHPDRGRMITTAPGDGFWI